MEASVRTKMLTGSLPMSEMIEKYVDVEKYLGCCAACPRYGQTWSCPPYDFDPAGIWPQYASVDLYAVQVFPESEEAKKAALEDPDAFVLPFRKELDALLEEKERETPGALRLDPGRCRACARCARRDNEPCRFPEKLRYSLESIGADVCGLAADILKAPIQWGTKESPAEYLVLAGAILKK